MRQASGNALRTGIRPVKCRAKGRAVIAGRRLHEDLSEWRVCEYLAIRRAIERDPPCERKARGTRALVHLAQHVEQRLFHGPLDACRNVGMTFADLFVASAWRTEELLDFRGKPAGAREVIVEKIGFQPEGAVIAQVHYVSQEVLRI